jgi:hypothetical protein
MHLENSVVAAFPDHLAAEGAVKALADSGFAMKQLSVLGRGYHTEEKVVGFYNTGDRVRFWGTRGAFWGALWGVFFGGLFVVTPIAGPVVALGYLGALALAAIENAVLVGGLSAVGAALYGLGVPKDTIVQYEMSVKADKFLVMAHGTAAEMARAKAVLALKHPLNLDEHRAADAAVGTGQGLAAAL